MRKMYKQNIYANVIVCLMVENVSGIKGGITISVGVSAKI